MLDLFAPIKCLLQEESVRVDNVVFRLHSRVTVLLLLVCTILVTAKQYIGEPISCMTDASIGTNSANSFSPQVCEHLEFLLIEIVQRMNHND